VSLSSHRSGNGVNAPGNGAGAAPHRSNRDFTAGGHSLIGLA
jgi:hypothetical protein